MMSRGTRIMVGHVLDELATLPDESVHMVWTSVPYWGLRSYGTEPQVWGGDPACEHAWDDARCRLCGAWCGEHGLEPTLDLWLAHEVEIFRSVRRVLRKDGTVWLNVGDAYATAPAGNKQPPDDDRTFREKPFSTAGPIYDPSGGAKGGGFRGHNKGQSGAHPDGRIVGGGRFKSKDRIMMPARLAIALHEDGWYIRDEIVWHKLNPMPSSVRDRTTPAHEMVYMLSKSARYYYDRVAIAEPIADSSALRHNSGERKEPTAGDNVWTTRNKRSVWPMALEPFDGAHFATAPTGLVRPCILAGTSAKGVCPHCGAPWVRATESGEEIDWRGGERKHAAVKGRQGATGCLATGRSRATLTTGWAPSCTCPDNEPIPAKVLDPFGGSGTTALVAADLGRDSILIELNPEYAKIARTRIRSRLHRVSADMPDDEPVGLPLFGGGGL